jgi:hypothetical protein
MLESGYFFSGNQAFTLRECRKAEELGSARDV